MADNQKFCEICGAEEHKNVCTSCGEEISDGANFCSHCGYNLKEAQIDRKRVRRSNYKLTKLIILSIVTLIIVGGAVTIAYLWIEYQEDVRNEEQRKKEEAERLSHEWQEVGPISVSNEYGISNHETLDQYVRTHSLTDEEKRQMRRKSDIVSMTNTLNNSSSGVQPLLYAKENQFHRSYKVKYPYYYSFKSEWGTRESAIQIGHFKTKGGQRFNARFLIEWDDSDNSYEEYFYFNIADYNPEVTFE